MNKEKIIGLMESIVSEKFRKTQHHSSSALAGTVLRYTPWETKGSALKNSHSHGKHETNSPRYNTLLRKNEKPDQEIHFNPSLCSEGSYLTFFCISQSDDTLLIRLF